MFIVNESSNPTPKYAYESDAGLDLMSNETITIPPHSVYAVGTGLRLALPNGTYGAVCSRSGMSIRGVVVNNAPGIIDQSYRGEIMVILRNQNSIPYRVNKGDKIAQLVIGPFFQPTIKCVNELEVTARGANGLGSTGR
jgi:dUTP pyrophosphatase